MNTVTQWFGIKKEKPTHVGVYQVRSDIFGAVWAKWDGKEWKSANRVFKLAAKEKLRSLSCYNGEYPHFRGLAQKPTAVE